MSGLAVAPSSPPGAPPRTAVGTGSAARGAHLRTGTTELDDAAAVVAVIAAMRIVSAAPGATDADTPRSRWADPAFRRASTVAPGPDSWWASGLAR